MKCDQCEMLSINGVPSHERGCPNTNRRYDADTQEWVQAMIFRLRYIQSTGLQHSGIFRTLKEVDKALERALNPTAYIECSRDNGATWCEYR